MLTATNIIYAVPSIALIVMLASLNTTVFGVVKFSYLSDAPIVVAMTLYTLIILVRNIVEAVRHLRSIIGDIRKIGQADSAELFEWAKQLQAPLPLVQEVAETGWLPVPLFCAGGLATPADAALAMQLGAEAVFVGSGIFKSDDPAPRAKAIVEATTHFRDADILAKVSRGLGAPMTGIGMDEINERYADRGW